MTGAQLARAIADLCSTRPDLDAKLATTLAKWLKEALGQLTTLEDYQCAAANGRGDFIATYLSTLSATDLARLAKKLDPHKPSLTTQGPNTNRAHLISLIRRECEPAKKPSTKQAPMPIERVLALQDPIHRRAELAKHTPAQLKKVIRDKHIDGAPISPKASKTELIEHIQAALAAGWPRSQSVLDGSKY
jgi:hypothetical protein